MVSEKALPNDNEPATHVEGKCRLAIQEMAYYKFKSQALSITGVLIKIVSGLLEIFSHFLLDGLLHCL